MQQLLAQPIGEAGAQPLSVDIDLGLNQTPQKDQAHQQPEARGNGKPADQGCGVRAGP